MGLSQHPFHLAIFGQLIELKHCLSVSVSVCLFLLNSNTQVPARLAGWLADCLSVCVFISACFPLVGHWLQAVDPLLDAVSIT